MDTVEHAEMVEKQLDALIERRSHKGGVDPDEREELWKASVRRDPRPQGRGAEGGMV